MTNTGHEHSASRSSKDNRGVGFMVPWWLDEDALCAELFQLNCHDGVLMFQKIIGTNINAWKTEKKKMIQ